LIGGILCKGKSMKSLYTATAVSAFALIAALVPLKPANAVLQIALTINGSTFTCVDNNITCDTNPATGTLQTSQTTFNGVTFLGSSQTSTKGATNDLNTTSFQITNTNATAVNYQLAVGDTSYVGPVTLLSQSGSGTFNNAIGSTIDMTYYADTANGQGADTPTDFPGAQQANSGVITATLISDSFNFESTSPFTDSNAYSMTLGTSGRLTAGGSLVGRSQDQIGFTSTVSVDEPGTLALMIGSIAGFGWFMRRNRKTYNPTLTA
jgi:hypothetical protein